MSNKTALRSMAAPSYPHGATAAENIAADQTYSPEFGARIHAEAARATAMPRWFWLLAPVVFVAAVAASAVWPWGWA